MEEDVEIELLLKLNESLLVEAAKETGSSNIREDTLLENPSTNSFHETKSLHNKENITENFVIECEENASVTAKNLEVIAPDVQTISSNNDSHCNFESFSKNPSTSLTFGSEVSHQKDSFIEGEDDLNQHILDLIATDPVKYYLSKQTSYVEQFRGAQEDEESSDDEWEDEYGYTDDDFSDDEWEDEYGYTDDDFSDDELEEPQITSPKKSQISGNKALQKLEIKALPSLTSLGRLLLKRGNFLSTLENRLQQLSADNKNKQKELQDVLSDAGKIKIGEPDATRCSFRKFGIPYFTDPSGFHPPPNKDHQEKIDNGELMCHLLPKANSWTKHHKEMMKNAIKKTIITEKSTMLTKEITELTEKMKNTKGKANKLLEKITDKQNELRALYKKSFKELVKGENENRDYDWMKFSISLYDGLHSAEECKRFWNNYLKPSINKSPWSDLEDRKLFEIAAKLEFQDWEKIASLLGTNRSAFQCFVHFRTRLDGRKDLFSGKWSKVEDKKLKTVVNSSKVGDFIPWSKVSAFMGNRNLNQIYNRWANSLNPEIVKGRFTNEEDLLIVTGVEVFGATFKQLALFMNNRTSSQIRERYERHLLPKTARVGAWSLEEDEKLLELVQKYDHNWSKIAKEMKIRTRTQVRQRYAIIEKMKKKNPDWTVSQVKRRNANANKKANKKNRDVASLKKLVGNVEKVFHLTDIDQETYLLEKLANLKERISSKKFKNRSCKRKKDIESTQVNDDLLDYFMCYNTKSVKKTDKSIHNDSSDKWKELCAMNSFFGHKLKLPDSEEEIRNNPRLNMESKNFLCTALKDNLAKNTPTSLSKEQSCPNLQTSVMKRISTESIDCPISDHDDTIIMMDWWHRPTIDVASLNFSECFKRTVFDYSNGMHKDIWDSKVRRCQMRNSWDNNSVSVMENQIITQNYNFPPNLFTTLCARSILLVRGTLEKLVENSDPDCFIKEEEIEDKVRLYPCKQFENNLLTLLTWPKVLGVTKIGTIPLDNIQNQKKNQVGKQGNTNVCTSLSVKKNKVINMNMEQNSSAISISQNGDKVDKVKLNVEPSNRKSSECLDENLSENTIPQPEQSVKKVKSGIKESDIKDVRKGGSGSQSGQGINKMKLDIDSSVPVTGKNLKKKGCISHSGYVAKKMKLDIDSSVPVTGKYLKKKGCISHSGYVAKRMKLDIDSSVPVTGKNLKKKGCISHSGYVAKKMKLDIDPSVNVKVGINNGKKESGSKNSRKKKKCTKRKENKDINRDNLSKPEVSQPLVSSCSAHLKSDVELNVKRHT